MLLQHAGLLVQHAGMLLEKPTRPMNTRQRLRHHNKPNCVTKHYYVAVRYNVTILLTHVTLPTPLRETIWPGSGVIVLTVSRILL